MKTISVAISEPDYAALKTFAQAEGRSVASVIREAMAAYRATVIDGRTPLRDLPVLAGHSAIAGLPSRADVYDEVWTRGTDGTGAQIFAADIAKPRGRER